VRRSRWASVAAAAAIAALAAVSAGCGGGAGSALSLDPVANAATKTQQAGPARIKVALSVSSPQMQGGKTVDVRGSGAIDGTSSELDFTVRSLGTMKEIALEQNGDYVLYMQIPQLSGQLPAGKHWIKLDASKLGKASGVDLSQLMSGIQPGDVLSMLKGEGAKLQNLGSATVDGTATTHYRVTIDPAKALESKGLSSPLLAGAAAKLPASLPADVWIGEDGLVRQVRFGLGVAQGRVALKMNLYDYGAHVPISAPPSSDVFDATQLAQLGMSGSAG
jgi:hypothetical protein